MKKSKPLTHLTKPTLPEWFRPEGLEQEYVSEYGNPMSREIQKHCVYALISMLYNGMVDKNGYYLQLYFYNNELSYYSIQRPINPMKAWLISLKENDIHFHKKVMHKRIGSLYSSDTRYMFVLKFKSLSDFNLARLLQPSEISGINPNRKTNPFSREQTHNNNKSPLISGKQLMDMVARAKSKPRVIKKSQAKKIFVK